VSETKTLNAGDQAPDFTLKSIGLKEVSLHDYRGKNVVWADWNANSRATFIVDKTGKVRFVERYGKGELPDPDKILGEIAKLG
jgi:peroxiredoxin